MNRPTTHEQALHEITSGRWTYHQIDTVVWYGSRVNGTASLDSDWDAVVFIKRPGAYEERIVTATGLDLLTISWDVVNMENWRRREICAVLMSDTISKWVDPMRKPYWGVDWNGLVNESLKRVHKKSALLQKYWHTMPAAMRSKQFTRLRHRAQRFLWYSANKDIPSGPQLDAEWEKMTTAEKRELLRPLITEDMLAFI